MSQSISFRFNVVNSICLIVLLIIFGTYNYQAKRATLIQQQTENIHGSLKRLEKNLPSMVWNYEGELVQDLLISELDNSSIQGLFVYDTQSLIAGKVRLADGSLGDFDQPEWDNLEERVLTFVDEDESNTVGRVVLLVNSAELEAILQTSLLTSVIQFLLMVVLLSIVGIVLLKNIVTGPLLELRDALQDIASGEGDLTRRLEVKRLDEIGQLSESFNGFVEQIHSLVSKITDTAHAMDDATHRLKGTANKTNDGTNMQRHETETAAASMNEMSATADEVSRNAIEAASAAESANADGQSAIRVLGEAIGAVEILVSKIEAGSSAVNQVEGDVQNITAVLEVIRVIAEQTNLLALNASIESARAGEQGRGFAVVADEVRNLAGKTQGCTDEIQDMITKLQQGTDAAVNAMNASKEQGSSTVELAHSANSSLHHIAESISTINDMNTQIAGAAEEQTAVTREINAGLVRIADIASDNADNAKDSEELSDQLTVMGKDMNRQVSQFKV